MNIIQAQPHSTDLCAPGLCCEVALHATTLTCTVQEHTSAAQVGNNSEVSKTTAAICVCTGPTAEKNGEAGIRDGGVGGWVRGS